MWPSIAANGWIPDSTARTVSIVTVDPDFAAHITLVELVGRVSVIQAGPNQMHLMYIN